MSNGVIVYEGPSQLDGEPIVVIATGLKAVSTNRKTGAMVQTYILRSDMPPIGAIKDGADKSICGDCVHRGDGTGKGRSCYVTIMYGPRAVYSSYKNGSYQKVTLQEAAKLMEDKLVRFGSYGDPAAAPLEVWMALALKAKAVTAYTHQWRTAHPGFAQYCMASVDSRDEMYEAHAKGYRTFRVAPQGEGPIDGAEIVCPASEEAGKKTTCEKCRACGGLGSKARVSIQIAAHGTGRKYVQ